MAKKRIRPAGDIFLDLEKLLDELIDSHKFQWGDILNWVYGHLRSHRPDAQENYVDGDEAEMKYEPKGLK